MDKVFVSYKDENEKVIKGIFFLIEESSNYIKIKSENNEITIPYHRLLKLKKKIESQRRNK